MIRVVVCSPVARDRVGMRSAIALAAKHQDISNIHIVLEPSPGDLANLLSNRWAGYVDIIACRVDSGKIDQVINVITDARAAGDTAHVVLVSSDEKIALSAFELGNASVFADSHPIEEFVSLVSKPLRAAYDSKRRIFTVKNSEGLENIPIYDLLFVETGKRGLLAHLPNGEVTAIRGAMQALCDRLQPDARFVRAGNSFLVNLDNVRSLGEGSVIFPDGESIVVPVRVRAPLKQALADYRTKGAAKAAG